jgi:hypothetical protein
MSDDRDWIALRVRKAASQISPVTDAAALLLEGLLRDRLMERQLTKAELAEVARELLAAMDSKQTSESAER